MAVQPYGVTKGMSCLQVNRCYLKVKECKPYISNPKSRKKAGVHSEARKKAKLYCLWHVSLGSCTQIEYTTTSSIVLETNQGMQNSPK